MASLRSRLVKGVLRFSRLLSEPTTLANLARKRRSLDRAQRLFAHPNATIRPVKQPGFRGEWIDIPEARKDTVLLYFYGGGFVFNSLRSHRDLVARIARAGRTRAFAVDYSLSPEHPYPSAVNEALAAYRWLLRDYKPHNIVVAGDSSGGSLTLSLLHLIRKHGLPNPACAVVISPATDAYNIEQDAKSPLVKDYFIKLANIQFFVDSYFQATPRNHPIASPLYGPLRGFPPLLIHVDKSELMYGQSKRLAEKAKKEGVDVTIYESQGLWHVWHLFARYVPEARAAIQQIGVFIDHYLDH